jgi:hypothetical protein
VVSRIGSTEWIRNGSMIVQNGSSVITPRLLHQAVPAIPGMRQRARAW